MNHLPTLFENTKGTAFAEALVTLPVFAAALAGVVALNSMYGAKLEAKARARRLAWLQADSGECPARSCRSGECGVAEGSIQAGGLAGVLQAQGHGFSVGRFLGNVAGYLVGRATRGVGVAEALMPNALGGGTTQQYGISTLLCNTTPRPVDQDRSVLELACSTGLGSAEYASEVCR